MPLSKVTIHKLGLSGAKLGSVQVLYKNAKGGGANRALMWYFNLRCIFRFFLLDNAYRCRTSATIMVPNNFCQNSDPLEERIFFSISKIDWVRAFFVNFWNVQSQIFQPQTKLFEIVPGPLWMFLIMKPNKCKPISNFPYFWLKYHLPMLQIPVCGATLTKIA